jgi:hypothetical protein
VHLKFVNVILAGLYPPHAAPLSDRTVSVLEKSPDFDTKNLTMLVKFC